jgi:hypothetical protein
MGVGDVKADIKETDLEEVAIHGTANLPFIAGAFGSRQMRQPTGVTARFRDSTAVCCLSFDSLKGLYSTDIDSMPSFP